MKRILIALVIFNSSAVFGGDYDHSVLRVRSVERNSAPGVAGFGSAVAVDLAEFGLTKGKYLLSAAHVIHDAASIDIELGARWLAATVVYEDEDYDVCILKFDGEIEALEIAREVPERVIGVGFKFGKTPASVNPGVCIARSTNHNKAMWRAALNIGPGCSGGGVMSRERRIAGIVIAGLATETGDMREDVTIFVPCTVLRLWIREMTQSK